MIKHIFLKLWPATTNNSLSETYMSEAQTIKNQEFLKWNTYIREKNMMLLKKSNDFY